MNVRSEVVEYRSLSALHLPHFLKVALADAGYKTVGDVSQISAEDLSAELEIGITLAEDTLRHIEDLRGNYAKELIGVAGAKSEPAGSSQLPISTQVGFQPTQTGPVPVTNPHIHSSTAAELLSTNSLPHFSTLSASLDDLISHFDEARGNGHAHKRKDRGQKGSIVPGMSIELSGPPGAGKTAIALGIALHARIGKRSRRSIEGTDEADKEEPGEVLIVDTEGAVTPDRVLRTAISMTRNISVPPRSLLGGIHLIRIATQVQMIAFVHSMDDWLELHPKVNLVILDTLSFPFRQPKLEMKCRARIMELVKQKIGSATTVHHCAVIVANQLATKLLTADNKPANFDTGDRAVLMPQLGDSWTTAKTTRIVLFRGGPGNDLRYAHASTSSGISQDVPWASFDIDSDGMPCDIPDLKEPPDEDGHG